MLRSIWSSLLLCLCVLFPAFSLSPSVLRYSITGSPLFRCAQVVLRPGQRTHLSHCPPPTDNVLSVSDRAPRASCPQSFSFDIHARGLCNTFLPGLRYSCEIRLLCISVWATKQGWVRGGSACAFVVVIIAAGVNGLGGGTRGETCQWTRDV